MPLIECDTESLYTFKKKKKTRDKDKLMLVPEIAQTVLLQEMHNYKPGTFISLG